MTKIDWHAARSRIVQAGETLGISEAAVAAIVSKSDRALNFRPELTAFCRAHGLSLDWIILGDVRPLLREVSRRRIEADAQEAAA